jgi:hypothetical protein
MVGNALIERKDVGAGDSRTSTRPGSLWRTVGASIAEMASITSLRTSDFDAKLFTVDELDLPEPTFPLHLRVVDESRKPLIDAVRRRGGYRGYVTRARARA